MQKLNCRETTQARVSSLQTFIIFSVNSMLITFSHAAESNVCYVSLALLFLIQRNLKSYILRVTRAIISDITRLENSKAKKTKSRNKKQNSGVV